MKRIIDNLLNSFNNEPIGYSARKLSSFVAVITSIFLSIKFCNSEILNLIIITWLGFGLLCLGIITMQQIINFKNGKENE